MAAATGPVLVLFTAPTWCRPCQQLEPHWEKAQDSELLDEFLFVRVDMGETQEDTGDHWATAYYGIQGVPQIYRFDGGHVDQYEPVEARTVVSLIKELTE